jgi:hypothetical protein
MKNGLGRNVNGPTRPSVTLPKSVSKSKQAIQILWFGFGEGLAMGIICKMKNGLGQNVNAGLKPLLSTWKPCGLAQ